MNTNFSITGLGPCLIDSPLNTGLFTSDDEKVLFHNRLEDFAAAKGKAGRHLTVELAGPRRKIFFDPTRTRAAIVTCGGLCPGINDVIRSVTMTLFYRYGVREILGIRYGLRGLNPAYGETPIRLTPDYVKDITHIGGSILSTSRGPQDPSVMVDYLESQKINILFCVGGDGTMRAAEKLTIEITGRKSSIAVIGIPKTIDNDLSLIEKSFGFDTAIEKTVEAVLSAHVEAKGAFNGIGLVKIMGRLSGYITATAALAQGDANFVLIPEVPFDLEGDRGFLRCLEDRIRARGHAVILAAEGAGQELMKKESDEPKTDASGNIRLRDIGLFLKNAVERHFRENHLEINLKYIEPSYMIRSVPANASDRIYCSSLGQYSVHAAMAGKTGLLVALRKNDYVHLPLSAATSGRQIDPQANPWLRVLEMTGQPAQMRNQ
ncbi:MAG: ATP-dependent 6-phosphofructokinase [Smithellaceae bacterium]|nr:ATP-dependent 6-phosphofructokinase [Syntrophaceae bacterium]MDD4240094.1 ATP-dependent 6-phosphofructokinase [Smithellaceae bacterium]NLX51458.1 ATP-dependent 6-phosphofructokinase [Deltaproteobacteria bacterium]